MVMATVPPVQNRRPQRVVDSCRPIHLDGTGPAWMISAEVPAKTVARQVIFGFLGGELIAHHEGAELRDVCKVPRAWGSAIRSGLSE